jgi:hypothetical protein
LFSTNLTGMSFGGMNISNVAMSLNIRGGYNGNLYVIWPGRVEWRCLPSSGVVSDNAKSRLRLIIANGKNNLPDWCSWCNLHLFH